MTAEAASHPRRQAGLRLALLWQRCDWLSGVLLCLMIVFSPWAFGGTPHWTVASMNIAGYSLGLLLAVKLSIRWFWHFRPPRWDDPPDNADKGVGVARWLTRLLAVMTVAILVYCAVSALNARASYDLRSRTFAYHEQITWLPHSYDWNRTWRYFWNYVGLAFLSVLARYCLPGGCADRVDAGAVDLGGAGRLSLARTLGFPASDQFHSVPVPAPLCGADAVLTQDAGEVKERLAPSAGCEPRGAQARAKWRRRLKAESGG